MCACVCVRHTALREGLRRFHAESCAARRLADITFHEGVQKASLIPHNLRGHRGAIALADGTSVSAIFMRPCVTVDMVTVFYVILTVVKQLCSLCNQIVQVCDGSFPMCEECSPLWTERAAPSSPCQYWRRACVASRLLELQCRR